MASKWNKEFLSSAMDDVPTCVLTYCCPCVTYGMNAEKAHGGDCLMHGLKYYLYACVCLCGLVAGPTRKAIRKKYDLPQQPEFLAGNEANSDCLVHTVPCVACFAHCQEAGELTSRGATKAAPIDPIEFSWAPVQDTATTTTTEAPKVEAAPVK